MNSQIRLMLLAASAAILFLATPAVTAQIRLDTGFVTTGAPPFDEPINPDRYLIRPGERLEVTFIDVNLPPLTLTVNPEGQVVYSGLGVIELSGLTLNEARKLLIDDLKKLYNTKEVAISVSLIYPVQVQVLGMVNRPGIYRGYTSQRVRDIIDSAAGIAPGGSSRRILFRGGPNDLQADIDLTTYTEKAGFNPYLYGGRKVIVPELTDVPVTVIGAVVNPRDIELLPGEGLADLVTLAGGLKSGADTASAVAVNEPSRDIHRPGGIKPGDQISVPFAGRSADGGAVVIVGAVANSSLRAPIGSVVTVADVIAKAGGVTPEANRDRIAVFRLIQLEAATSAPPQRFPIWITPGSETTFHLKASDSVFVPVRLGFVELSGSVVRPGLYPYSDGLKVVDCMTMAGGQVAGIVRVSFEITDHVTGVTRLVTASTPVSDGDKVMVKSLAEEQ